MSGEQFYPMLAEIRLAVNDRLENSCGIVTDTEQEERSSSTFQVIPNPVTNGIIRIRLNTIPITESIELYDRSGSLISQQYLSAASAKQTIEFKQLSQGFYFVKLGQESQKVAVY